MKRFLPLLVLAVFALPFGASAQGMYDNRTDHIEAGVYGEFYRLNDANIDFAGLGGRAGFNVNPYIQLEAEMSYDFAQTFSETFSNSGTVTVVNSDARVLHGLIGPKIQTNKGPVRLFLTAKGGFINFMFDPRNPSFNTFTSSIDNLRFNNVEGEFYPGAGAEAFWGPFGLRLDAGDEIYFNHGTHNNLRISLGPTIRF